VFEGITAAGTVPDSHRIPLHRDGPKPPDYHLCAAKVQHFPQSPTKLQEYSKIKKKKALNLIEKSLISSALMLA
jgi:hypothetical protein